MKDVSDRTTRVLLWVLLLTGAALRVYGAWCSRLITDPDCGVVALMARHMAEGRDFPVFFYGQAYMGSLEPAVSALFCKLFGVSGFMVNLGPALVGWLLLPVMFVWARRTGGNTAGLAATAFCVIGPEQFFYFQFAARGGYPMALLFGSLVLMLSARLAVQQRDAPASVNPLAFALLGVLAGLGWWSNPIIIAALLAAGLIFLLVLRGRALAWQVVLPVLAGFMVGSLPFWIWNARHGWESFAFLTAFHGTSVRAGLHFLALRSLRLVGLESLPLWQKLPLLLVYLGAPVYLIVRVGAHLRRRILQESDAQILTVLLFVGFSCFLFVRSHFSHLNTVRYLLPLVPAAAFLLGQATAGWSRVLPFGAGWIPCMAVMLLQLPAVRNVDRHGRAYDRDARQPRELAAWLKGEGIRAVYANYMFHSMNFLLDGDVCFATLKNERYPPLARCTETAARIAIANNNGGIKEFMRYGGGHVRWQQVGGVYLVYGFESPAGGLREIDRSRWSVVGHTFDVLEPGSLSDDQIETMARAAGRSAHSVGLDIEFTEPVDVAAVRCVSRDGKHPPAWSVQVRTDDTASWEPLFRPSAVSLYFWSGPRPFWDGAVYRLEARCASRTVRRMRFEFQQTVEDPAWNIAELQFFGPGGPAGTNTLKDVARALDYLGCDRVYADRWEANGLWTLSDGRLRTSLEPDIWGTSGLRTQVTLTTNTALLVREENAPLTRRVLRARHLAAHETALSPWVIFDFNAGESEPVAPGAQGLVWKGYGCLMGDSKRYAAELIERAEALHSGADMSTQAVALLEQAVQLYPYWMNPQARLSKWTGRKSRPRGSEAWSALSGAAASGGANLVRFANGVEFLGVAPMDIQARPGERMTLKYLWRSPPNLRREHAMVFIHFEGAGFAFQDDHPLLEEIADDDLSFQPYFEIFTEERTVIVPPEAPAGKYTITLGLYDPVTGKRWKPERKMKVDNRALVLPVVLNIAR